MPISHLLINELLLFKAEGEVTPNAFHDAWNRVAAGPSVAVPIDTLVDLRNAHIDVPGPEIEAMVFWLERHRVFNKIAIVADRGSFTYAMGRMFCINYEFIGCQAETFIHIEDALAWLSGRLAIEAYPQADTCLPDK